MEKFHSHGKLLITGEYVVLDGATALALPTRLGQSLEVRKIAEPVIRWKSIDHTGQPWLMQTFKLSDIIDDENPGKQQTEVSERLLSILISLARMNPGKFRSDHGFEITTRTDFPGNWGLGTSSTLIVNLATWCGVDAYKLLEQTFGGSGYDIAIAQEGTPLMYTKNGPNKDVLKVSFDPPFKENLFFIHLNEKQNSRESIKAYREQHLTQPSDAIEKISALSYRLLNCRELWEFNLLLEIHENVISRLTGMQKVKSRLFPDFPGSMKSLGGWGGDFILATGDPKEMQYFREKGYTTIVPFSEMILQ